MVFLPSYLLVQAFAGTVASKHTFMYSYLRKSQVNLWVVGGLVDVAHQNTFISMSACANERDFGREKYCRQTFTL